MVTIHLHQVHKPPLLRMEPRTFREVGGQGLQEGDGRLALQAPAVRWLLPREGHRRGEGTPRGRGSSIRGGDTDGGFLQGGTIDRPVVDWAIGPDGRCFDHRALCQKLTFGRPKNAGLAFNPPASAGLYCLTSRQRKAKPKGLH